MIGIWKTFIAWLRTHLILPILGVALRITLVINIGTALFIIFSPDEFLNQSMGIYWKIPLLLSLIQILIIFMERKKIQDLHVRQRIEIRIVTATTIIVFFASLTHLAPFSRMLDALCIYIINIFHPEAITGRTNTNTTNGGTSPGSHVDIVLAVLGIIISFIATLIYAIASDAKEQVEAVKKSLNMEEKFSESKLNLVRLDVVVYCVSMLSEISNALVITDTCTMNRKSLLKLLPIWIGEIEELLAPICNEAAVLKNLKKINVVLRNRLEEIQDRKFYLFLHTKVAPYLEALHSRLYHSRHANSKYGQDCISEIEQIWQQVRYDKRIGP